LFQLDPHRNSLHDFYPVSGGIFGRDEGKGGAGACPDSGHLPTERVSGIDIGRYGGGLSQTDVCELCFLEIGLDVNLLEWDDSPHGLPRLNPVANLNISLSDVAIDWRHNAAVGQIQPGCLKIGHRFVALGSERLNPVLLDIDIGPLAHG
jgi:hypothetical protein